MVDIHSATTEIRRGKKEERKKPQGKNIMSASATQGSHNNNKLLTNFDKRPHRRGNIFMGESLMWHLSASAVAKGIGAVAYTNCRTCTHSCLLPGSPTAEGSTVFSRWCQCAHPTDTLFLQPMSQPSKWHLDWFSCFCTTHSFEPWTDCSMASMCTLMYCNNDLFGLQGCAPKRHLNRFSSF